ncbi:hypothetical protein [Microtetraspora glauca]|uniref:YbaB/EbfC family DNA-binding protein n=1 Tax=Microtetraspora glauca TaxID=1996 RepID=A0ABV3G6R1_MICGL
MTGFGDFANIDIEQFIQRGDREVAQMREFENALSSLVGRARDEDGLVSVEYTSVGLGELELHPKAMRLSSGELAEKIKATIKEAGEDLQRQVMEASEETFGKDGNPMKLLEDPGAISDGVAAMTQSYNRTFEDVMGELERIKRQLDDSA